MRRCPSGRTSVIMGEMGQGRTRAWGHGEESGVHSGAWMEVLSRDELGVSREGRDGVHGLNDCGAGLCWRGPVAAGRPPLWPARCSWTQQATPSESEPRPGWVLSPSYLPWKEPSQL